MTTSDERRAGKWNGTLRSAALLALVLGAGCRPATPPGAPEPASAVSPPRIIPAPASLSVGQGAPFAITAATRIVVDGDSASMRVADVLAALLRKSSGFAIPVAAGGPASPGSIHLSLAAGAGGGEEGYELTVTSDSVHLAASRPSGLFHATQTLRQLLPSAIESEMHVSNGWLVPAVVIADRPRFAWRGAMLDVSRHFFTVHEVEQFIDLLALYKLNVLHLHLADDQGWRIAIASRPKLTALGSNMQVGGGAGGFYTQDDYAAIVRYAQARYVTIVPEIDMPSHINAAMIAYPELSCGQRPPAPYTGTEVGWSALCVDKEETYAFVDDVIRELAAITPGAFLHIGGDEVKTLTAAQYTHFIERVQEIVTRHGKRMVGWGEIANAALAPTSVAQQWAGDSVAKAVRRGAKVILSPGSRMYLDMKYSPATELGLHWAGYVGVRTTYDWDPAAFIAGVGEGDLLGVEAPLWSETVRNITAAQFMIMPRLPAVAELAWSPQTARDWGGFRERLASHAPRWHLLGVNYFRSDEIPW